MILVCNSVLQLIVSLLVWFMTIFIKSMSTSIFMSLRICCDEIYCFNQEFWFGLLNAMSLPLTKIKTRLSAHIQCREENGYNLMIIFHLT